MRDISCTRTLARIGQVVVRQKQMSAAMSVKHIQCTEMCVYKIDGDNCDNEFSNSGNSSNTDSSDNEQ